MDVSVINMALRTYLYSFENLDVLSKVAAEEYLSQCVWLDERAYELSLCWMALFRADDLLEYSFSYQPLREVSGRNLDVVGPWPDPVTKKRIAPVAPIDKALRQLEQSKAVLAETFPEHPNLVAWLDEMKRHLRQFSLPWLAIEWSELAEAGESFLFLNEMRWIFEGWDDSSRTLYVTPPKSLLDRLLFRKPAVQARPWRDEFIKWTGLDLSLGIPPPRSGSPEEHEQDSNANFYRLFPSQPG